MSGHKPQQRADDGADHGAERCDQQACPQAEKNARQHVAPDLVGSKHMVPSATSKKRRLEACENIGVTIIIGRQKIGTQSQNDERDKEDQGQLRCQRHVVKELFHDLRSRGSSHP